MSETLTAKIKEVLVQELNLQDQRPEDIADDMALFGEGLGLDSLDALQLAVALEERFGVKIPEGDEAREIFQNVASIAAFIERSSAEPA
ncbi:MAG: phosphopantetheine-binding protein [Myxococcota bacterium]